MATIGMATPNKGYLHVDGYSKHLGGAREERLEMLSVCFFDDCLMMNQEEKKNIDQQSMSSRFSELDHQSEAVLAVTYRLKGQIDQLFKLVNRQNVCLKRTNRFRNYLKTVVAGNNIDTEKLHCELSKYEQNYSLCWKRCRKLNRKLLGRRSSTKTTASDTALYDTLYDLLQSLTTVADDPQLLATDNYSEVICLTENVAVNSIDRQNIRLLGNLKKTLETTSVEKSKKQNHNVVKNQTPVKSTRNTRKIKLTNKGVSDVDNQAKGKRTLQVTVSRGRKKNVTKSEIIDLESMKEINLSESSSSLEPSGDIAIESARSKRTINRTKKSDKPTTGSRRKRRNLNGKVKCDFEGCTYVAKLPYMLAKHMIVHSEERPFKCEFDGCEYRAKTVHILAQHGFTHSTERPFECEQCGKRYKSTTLLKTHHITHRTDRFRCQYEGCEASYKEKKVLRKHVRYVHTKEAPLLKCEWPDCNYSTFRPQRLKIHGKVHTGERPFKCIWPDCEKAFKTSSGLNVHNLMHKNERRHKCRWSGCDYSCNLLGNLQKHEAIHERKQQQQKGIPTIPKGIL